MKVGSRPACAGALLGVLAAVLGIDSASAQKVGSRDYGPMVLGDWLFTPQLTVGGIYNDNVFSRRTNKVGSFGSTFTATGYANRNDGTNQTGLYFKGQADVYPGESRGNAFTGAVGANHSHEFGPDLLFRGDVEIARLQNSLRSQSINPAGSLSPSNANYTQFQGSLSLKKLFNRFYIEGGTSASTQVYDRTSGTTADKNGWSGVIRGRVGYEISPMVSVYAEPSLNLQRYNSSFYDTNVYKSVVGLSFPRLGLFTGDVYAGYMWANYPNAINKWDQAPTVGGSISWLPTPGITITLAASQSFGLNGPNQNSAYSVLSTIPGAVASGDVLSSSNTANSLANQIVAATAVNQQLFASSGAQSKTSTVTLGGRYEVNVLTTAGLTFSYQNTSRSGVTTTPTSDVVMARLSLDYQIWANWGIAGTYSLARVLYNQPGLSYSQNVVTLGLSGRL